MGAPIEGKQNINYERALLQSHKSVTSVAGRSNNWADIGAQVTH